MKTLIIIENEEYNSMPDLYRNDLGITLNFELRYADDSIVDLTGGSVTFKMKEINTSTNKISSACTAVDDENGEFKYVIQTNDLNSAGVYDAELQVTNSGATIINTIPLGRLRILEDLP